MNKVKITVLKTTLDKELAAEYGAEGLTACPMMKEGQCFMQITQNRRDFATKPGKPFTSMFLRLPTARGKTCFITATGLKKPGVAICSCNDGLRPVIFKLEATDEQSEIDYTPVR